MGEGTCFVGYFRHSPFSWYCRRMPKKLNSFSMPDPIAIYELFSTTKIIHVIFWTRILLRRQLHKKNTYILFRTYTKRRNNKNVLTWPSIPTHDFEFCSQIWLHIWVAERSQSPIEGEYFFFDDRYCDCATQKRGFIPNRCDIISWSTCHLPRLDNVE